MASLKQNHRKEFVREWHSYLVRNIVKHFDTHTALKDVSVEIEKGRAGEHPGPFRLRQNHTAADYRGAGDGGLEDRCLLTAETALLCRLRKEKFRHRFPVLCPVSPYDGGAEHSVRAESAEAAYRRKRGKPDAREVLEMVDLYDQRKEVSFPDVRRSAAEGGPGHGQFP
jgi:hypothetical protein